MNNKIKVVYNSKKYSCSDLHIEKNGVPACGAMVDLPMFFEDTYSKITDLMCHRCKNLANLVKN